MSTDSNDCPKQQWNQRHGTFECTELQYPMAFLLDTNDGAEGCSNNQNDELKAFFNEHNKKLNTDWYYQLVDHKIDYDDLMESKENDLRNILQNECGLSGIAMTRIINIIRKMPQSEIHKESNNTKVSIVSTEEHLAAQQIEKETEKISRAKANVAKIMNSLDANAQQCEKQINDIFDDIVNNANKRRQELISQLQNVKNDKHQKLLKQHNILSRREKELTEFHDETQQMMKDTKITFY